MTQVRHRILSGRHSYRLPVAVGRCHSHYHGIRWNDVQHLLELGAVRTPIDLGAHPGWTRGCPGAGVNGGRKPISPDDPRVVTAKRLHKDHSLSIDQICGMLGNFQADILPLLGAA